MAFPASSEYEIELKVSFNLIHKLGFVQPIFQLGDVISLVKRRDDGWCKGTLHRCPNYMFARLNPCFRTGKTGLFPVSFVEKI